MFTRWDKQGPSLTLLVARLYQGSQHLLIGRHLQGFGLLQFYYWILLCVLIAGFVMICGRFFRDRAEVQHLALTTIGFLAFQIGFFFFREPLSRWSRYFILYLPYVVLLTATTVSRLAQRPIRRASLRDADCPPYSGLERVCPDQEQLSGPLHRSRTRFP